MLAGRYEAVAEYATVLVRITSLRWSRKPQREREYRLTGMVQDAHQNKMVAHPLHRADHPPDYATDVNQLQ